MHHRLILQNAAKVYDSLSSESERKLRDHCHGSGNALSLSLALDELYDDDELANGSLNKGFQQLSVGFPRCNGNSTAYMPRKKK